MKKINSGFITDTALQPFKQGTWEHLQSSYQEAFAALAQFFKINDYSPTVAYILYGMEYSVVSTTFTITAGAVFYDGELYLVDAGSGTTTGGNVPVLTITTTQFTADRADPVDFLDGSSHNVHDITKLVISSAAAGSGDANFTDCERLHSAQAGISTSLTWGSSYTIDLRSSKSLHFPSTSFAAGALVIDFLTSAAGAVVKLFFNIDAAGTVHIPGGSNAVVYLLVDGTMTKTNLTGDLDLAWAAGGDVGLDIEFLGYGGSATPYLSIKQIGN